MTALPGPAPDRLVVDSPIGPLVVEGDRRRVTHLYLANTGMAAATTAAPPAPEPLVRAADQLDEYFDGRRTKFDLPLDPAGTPFQAAVWWALADIPYGWTISYAELASWVGRPGAFRAVGRANGANPLPVFLPCHRVVASGGGLGGYGGGLDVKRRLLALEGWSPPAPFGAGRPAGRTGASAQAGPQDPGNGVAGSILSRPDTRASRPSWSSTSNAGPTSRSVSSSASASRRRSPSSTPGGSPRHPKKA